MKLSKRGEYALRRSFTWGSRPNSGGPCFNQARCYTTEYFGIR